MKLAVLSDIHANIDALRAALGDAERCQADVIVSLGDVVGYNCFPRETIALLKEREIKGVVGNHDLMAIQRLEPTQCGPNARKALAFTREAVGEAEIDYLENLPDRMIVEPGVLMIHSALGDPVTYLRTPEHYAMQYRVIREQHPSVRICLTGHTHMGRVVSVHAEGAVRMDGRRNRRLDDGVFYFLNPGSVGHPRQEDYRASYLLYDSRTHDVVFRKVPYDKKRVERANAVYEVHTDLGPSVLRYTWRQARRAARALADRIVS